MSVPFSKRGKNELMALNKAEDLLEYTFGVCLRKKKGSDSAAKRETVIPLRHWAWFTSPLLNLAHSAYRNLFLANEIMLDSSTTKAMYEKRLERQTYAIACLQDMLADISFAWRKFGVRENTIICWGNLVNETIDLAQGWKTSDKRRFAEIEAERLKDGGST